MIDVDQLIGTTVYCEGRKYTVVSLLSNSEVVIRSRYITRCVYVAQLDEVEVAA